MADEQKPGEIPEPNEQPAEKPTGMVEIDAAELEKIRKALKEANAEAAKHRKAAEAAEAERKAKAEAEMTELQKVAKRAEELEAALKGERKARLQQEAAAKVGLPAKLASRLQGETPEELEEDAKAILESLPKPAKPQPGPVANPGGNGQQGETLEQQLARIHGQSTGAWDIEVARKRGGGVFAPPE